MSFQTQYELTKRRWSDVNSLTMHLTPWMEKPTEFLKGVAGSGLIIFDKATACRTNGSGPTVEARNHDAPNHFPRFDHIT